MADPAWEMAGCGGVLRARSPRRHWQAQKLSTKEGRRMYGYNVMFQHVYKHDAMKREQHGAVRNAAGWYYFTHHVLEVAGEDASAFLDRIFVNPIASLKTGSARYTTMLNEDGIIIDDVVIFRLEENKYWVSTLYAYKTIKWFDAHKGESRITYENITEKTDMFAVQGPKSKDLLNSFLAENIDGQKFFTIRDNRIGDIPVKISRAGFSGEKVGYEIYFAPGHRKLVEEKLAMHGEAVGAKQITDFQVMVWTLPTEKGFYTMPDLRGANPLEVGFERAINWDKDFIGKEALAKIKEEGPRRQLLGFTVDAEEVHISPRNLSGPGLPLTMGGEEVGVATKFTYGYTAEKNIGYALVEVGKAKIGDTVDINGYEAVLTDKVFC
jgi:aminomethyltransferase